MSITSEIFAREGISIIDDIGHHLESSDAVATGKTAASLEYIASDERLLILGGAAFGLNHRDQLSFVAAGRGYGLMPPKSAIEEWAIARGIISDAESGKGIVYAIRLKIAQSGTNLWQQSAARDIYQSVITDERIRSVQEQITDLYVDKVLSDIVKSFPSAT